MSSPFKMNPGRGPMQKTGRGIPNTMCSPAMQMKDAVSGKEVPADAVFGKTKTTFKDGYEINTTGYKTPGTPGSQGGPAPTQPNMPNDQWKEFKKNETPGDKAERLGRNGINGSVVNKSFMPTMAGIKPIVPKFEAPSIEGKTKRTPTRLTGDYTPRTPKTTGIIKKVGKGLEKAADYINDKVQLPTKRKGNLNNCYSDH